MAKLSIQTPDGKTLLADVPPGTDPSQLGAIADEVSQHYMTSLKSNPESMEFERGPNYPTAAMSASPSLNFIPIGIGGSKVAGAAAKAGLETAETLGRGIGKLATPSVESAEAALMPALEKAGLKDVPPVIFGQGEKQAAIDYAQAAAKNAENLHPVKLQEARATLKDVLDNLIKPDSPSGQIVSRAKDAVTTALKNASQRALESPIPDTEGLGAVGPGLENLAAAHAAEPIKAAVQKALTGAIPFGLGYAARNALRIPRILYGAGQQ